MYIRRLTRALQATIALALIWPAVAAADSPNADLDHDKVMDNLESHIAALPDDAKVRLIVSLDRTVTSGQVTALEREVGDLDVKERFSVVDAVALTATKDQVRDLAAQGVVDRVEEDLPMHSDAEDAPFNAFNESAQDSFGVSEARLDDLQLDGDADGDPSYSPDDLVAAVIDTGIDTTHVDLDENKVLGFVDCTVHPPSGCVAKAPFDNNGHGTHVAATIAGEGDGQARFRGVAPGAALVGVKVLGANGVGNTSDVVAGIQWVIDNKDQYGIEAINLSLGSDAVCGKGDSADSQAVNKAWGEARLAVMVAAGNDGPASCTISSPGDAKNDSLTVGSMADLGALGFMQAHSSSRGPTLDHRTKPDISAPGVGITSAAAGTGSGYVSMSGTSMATPFVTGVALLMMDANASYTNDVVKDKIRDTAIDWGRGKYGLGPDDDYGAGRLDAYAALAAADPGLLTSPPRVPNHVFRQGSLSGTGQVLEYAVDVAETTFPLAATLIDVPTGCRAPTSDPDFDMKLIAPNGAVVDTASSSDRQDELGYRPTATGLYKLRVYSFRDCGDFFMDVSGGSVSSSATSNPDAPKGSGGGTTTAPTTTTPKPVAAAALVNAARITARRAAARLRKVGLRKLLRRGRLTFSALSPAAGRLDLAVRMKVHGKRVMIARATRRVNAAGQPRLNVRLTRAGRRLLARSRSVRFTVRAAVTDGTSRRRTANRAVRVRR